VACAEPPLAGFYSAPVARFCSAVNKTAQTRYFLIEKFKGNNLIERVHKDQGSPCLPEKVERGRKQDVR